MKDSHLPEEMLLAQVAEALEERQRPDRRQAQLGLPQNVTKERRKKDRRAKNK